MDHLILMQCLYKGAVQMEVVVKSTLEEDLSHPLGHQMQLNVSHTHGAAGMLINIIFWRETFGVFFGVKSSTNIFTSDLKQMACALYTYSTYSQNFRVTKYL